MPGEPINTRDYEISLAAPEDIPGILTLQDPNVMDRGGTLSVPTSSRATRLACVTL